MPRYLRSWDKSKYTKYLNEGRGQGELSSYKPWITVQSFPSRGMVSRVYGCKTNRIHHLLSSNELCFFYTLDWSDSVIDIREQYPLLDLELAMQIADKLEIRYPYDNISGFPYVLTSDFMITTTSGIKVRTIKMVSELTKRRVLEKLAIERKYWEMQGVDWAIITDREINKQKAYNIEWLTQARDLRDFAIDDDLASMITMRFLEYCTDLDMTYLDIATRIEIEFNLSQGIGVCVFKYLTYKKKIAVNVDEGQLPNTLVSPRNAKTTMLGVI